MTDARPQSSWLQEEKRDQRANQSDKSPLTFKGTPPSSMKSLVAGEELADLAETDSRIVVLTADLAGPNRMKDFQDRHSDRFFNLGIAEQNMLSVAAGMAASGFVPFAATFASFAVLLGCEQLRTDCAYPGLPVRVIGTHAGMAMGYYGTSHHALEDLAITRSMADMTVVCPTDANLLRAVLRASLEHPGAMYIRLGRGRDPEVYPSVPEHFEFGKANCLIEGSDVVLIATGSQVPTSLRAAKILEDEKISAGVVDMCTIKPLDREEILRVAGGAQAVLTVEEHNVTGGLGSAVAEVIAESGTRVLFGRHGVPDTYVTLGPPRELYSFYQLTPEGIASRARSLLGV
jgi:transketolase